MGELESAAGEWRAATAAWEARELREVVEATKWSVGAAEAAVTAAGYTMIAARATAKAAAEEQSKGWETVADEWEEAAVGLSAIASPEAQENANVSGEKLVQTPVKSGALCVIWTCTLMLICCLAVSFTKICTRSRILITGKKPPLLNNSQRGGG